MIDRQRVIRLRKHLGLKPFPFSQAIGMDKNKYYRFERGESDDLPASAAGEIIARYRVHPNWLFFGEGGEGPVFQEEVVSKREFEQVKEKLAEALEEVVAYQRKEIRQEREAKEKAQEQVQKLD